MRRWGIVPVLCWALSGCMRLGFERAVDPRQDQGGATDSAVREAAADVHAGEGQPVDQGAADRWSAADGPSSIEGGTPAGPLTCSTPQLVGGTTTLPHLSEAALRTSGLTLVARTMSVEGYETSRTAHGQPFGVWTASTLLAGGEDPTFFDLAGTEHAVVARSGSTDDRHLELCTMAGTCTTLTLEDQNNQTITEDVDGPSVAALPNGPLLMAFNLNLNGGTGETSIYLAQTNAASLYTWTVAPATALNQNGVKEDDPALSPDGLVLIFNKDNPGMNGDLFVSERASVTQPFPAPRPLVDVNSAGVEGSAFLGPLPTVQGKTRYELFFSSTASGTGGAYLVHRSVCQR